jgi:hypothetical protein
VELLNLAPMIVAPRTVRRVCAIVAWLCAACVSVSSRAQSPDVEYAVKATYLYKFAPFVEWPVGVFAAPAGPFVICVAGNDPVAALADEAVRGQRVGAHPIEVLHLPATGREAGCHVLYVAQRGNAGVTDLRAVRGKPVLTVTDDADDAHGIINFVVRDNRVRFEIDQNAAAENNLVISSKLLNLAVRVRPKV